MNSRDRKTTLAEQWAKFDKKGFSFYWMQYQNLPSEGKVLFKTNNACSMFLQKLDTFRKYCFAVYGVYGVEEDYVCRGVFMWRGVGIPEEVKSHDCFEYMDVKALDFEKDMPYIEEYWLNLNENDKVDGRLVCDAKTFK
jgi:elongation factor 1-gamma